MGKSAIDGMDAIYKTSLYSRFNSFYVMSAPLLSSTQET